MPKYFNEKKWNQAIKYPDWYLRIKDDLLELLDRSEKSERATRTEIKNEVYGYFEQQLLDDRIHLGKTGRGFDDERKPIDTIVVHHTAEPAGMELSYLNAMHLLRLYVRNYAEPYDSVKEKIQEGQPIYSGHFYKGEQVFWAYHWLVRADGATERILNDEYIGWHAGDWDVNRRSIAICLDGDFRETSPPMAMVEGVADIVNKYYAQIETERVLGHREVNPTATCPGSTFLDGWKQEMIDRIEQS